MGSEAGNVTTLLIESGKGDQKALDALMPMIYDELRRLASSHLRNEGPGHTLQSTALVHEAYIRLVNQKEVKWQNRAHFFAIASKMIRRILVDHARKVQSGKRGGGAAKVSLDETPEAGASTDVNLSGLDEVLNRLEEVDPQQARVVELRYFGGLTIEETAEALRISAATVKRDWTMAKAWLMRELRNTDERG